MCLLKKKFWHRLHQNVFFSLWVHSFKEKYSGKGVPVIWIRPMSTTPVKDAGYRGKWSVVRGLQLTLVEEQRRPCTMRLLPSSSSLAVGASKQIMFGGCLALRRSLWTSCKLRRSFVVSSNFCWMFRASVWGKENTQRVNTSSEFLQLPSGNPPPPKKSFLSNTIYPLFLSPDTDPWVLVLHQYSKVLKAHDRRTLERSQRNHNRMMDS